MRGAALAHENADSVRPRFLPAAQTEIDADAVAVESAREQNAILVTGDPELWQLSKREPIELLWLGKKQAH